MSMLDHLPLVIEHYSYVMMSAMVSQITVVLIACSSVCSGADQRKHRSSASLAFVRECTCDSLLYSAVIGVCTYWFLYGPCVSAILNALGSLFCKSISLWGIDICPDHRIGLECVNKKWIHYVGFNWIVYLCNYMQLFLVVGWLIDSAVL